MAPPKVQLETVAAGVVGLAAGAGITYVATTLLVSTTGLYNLVALHGNVVAVTLSGSTQPDIPDTFRRCYFVVNPRPTGLDLKIKIKVDKQVFLIRFNPAINGWDYVQDTPLEPNTEYSLVSPQKDNVGQFLCLTRLNLPDDVISYSATFSN